jgi:hypothetical protein
LTGFSEAPVFSAFAAGEKYTPPAKTIDNAIKKILILFPFINPPLFFKRCEITPEAVQQLFFIAPPLKK